MKHYELYDISSDVNEKQDLKDKHPKVLAQLKAQLTEWQATLPEKPTGDVFSELRKDIKSK
jgi:hypothetical protein